MKKLPLFLLLAFILALSLSCSKAGKILTPAEATASAMPTEAPTLESAASVDTFQVGDVVYLVNKSYLVNIFDAPGSKKIVTAQQRGVQVTVLKVSMASDGIWYQIKSPAGTGWVPAINLSEDAP